MKKARHVSIPDDRRLTESQYEELLTHARRSAEWNIVNFGRNETEVREKLRRKGYVTDDVHVVGSDGSETDRNLIEETITYLKETRILDDAQTLENLIYDLASSGKSMTSVRMKALQRRFPAEDVDKAVESYRERYGDEDERTGLDRAAGRIISTASFGNLTWRRKKQRFIGSLVSKGYQMNDIFEWIDAHEEIFDEDREY